MVHSEGSVHLSMAKSLIILVTRGMDLSWQGVVTPDGLIISLDGPYLGNAADCTIFQESPLPQKIESFWPEEDSCYRVNSATATTKLNRKGDAQCK